MRWCGAADTDSDSSDDGDAESRLTFGCCRCLGTTCICVACYSSDTSWRCIKERFVLSASHVAAPTLLFVLYLSTSPYNLAVSLRWLARHGPELKPISVVAAYSLPHFVMAVCYTVHSLRTSRPSRQVSWTRAGDHVLVTPFYAAAHILTALACHERYIRLGSYVMLAQGDLFICLILAGCFSCYRPSWTQLASLAFLAGAAGLYLCMRYNDQYFPTRFPWAHLKGYIYIAGARLSWSLCGMISKVSMYRKGKAAKSRLSPVQLRENPDLMHHTLPDCASSDAELSLLDRILQCSLYSKHYLGIDPRGCFELHTVGGGLGLFPIATLCCFVIAPVITGSQQTVEDRLSWATDLWDALKGSWSSSLMLLYCAVIPIVHPWVLGEVVLRYHPLFFVVTELVTIILAVVVGSYLADKDSDDPWHPVTVVQAIGLSLFAVGFLWWANASLARHEGAYAERSVQALLQRLPELAMIETAKICAIDSADGRRAYRLADQSDAYSTWHARDSLPSPDAGEGDKRLALRSIMEDTGRGHLADGLLEYGVSTTKALKALDEDQVQEAGLSSADRKAILAEYHSRAVTMGMLSEMCLEPEKDATKLRYPPWVVRGWHARDGLSGPLRDMLRAEALEGLQGLLLKAQVVTLEELARYCDEDLEDELGIGLDRCAELLDGVERAVGTIDLRRLDDGDVSGLQALLSEGVGSVRQLQRLDDDFLESFGLDDATRSLWIEKAVALHAAPKEVDATSITPPPMSARIMAAMRRDSRPNSRGSQLSAREVQLLGEEGPGDLLGEDAGPDDIFSLWQQRYEAEEQVADALAEAEDTLDDRRKDFLQ